jgi:hypothetical protein
MASLDNSIKDGSATTKEETPTETKETPKTSKSESTKPSSRRGAAADFKSTSERMAESVYLVKQLTDVGIGNTHPHMKAFREVLNRWIREPDYSYSGRIDFSSYGRRGDLVLPRGVGHVASLRLRSI